MATSINSYSVKFSMDASGFVDATKLSRSEARALIKDIEAARDPFERYAVEHDRLKRALDAGAIDQGVYNRLLSEQQKQLPGVTAAMGPYAVAIGTVTAGFAAAGAATVAFIREIRQVQNTIDDAADSATRSGVSFTDLKSLQFTFKEAAGIDAATVDQSISKMQINIAKAVEGDKVTRAAFARLGLDAGQLMGVGPRQAMMQIADAMQGVNSHAERLRLSMEIFGKSGAALASSLGQGSESLGNSLAFAEKWLGLTEQQVAAVGMNNDAWDRIGIVVEGVTQKVAAELAPVMNVVADNVLGIANGWDDIDNGIRSAVDTSVAFVANLIDAADYARTIYGAMSGLQYINTDEIFSIVSGEEQKTTAEKWMESLEAKRKQIEEKAAQEIELRQAGRHYARLLETEDEYKKRMEAEDKVGKEEQRQIEEAARERRRTSEQALRAAQKYFDDEIKRQEKMRADVAKGPGSGMEIGSQEYVRFMAQQTNQAIADSIVKVDQKPTDEQLVEQAKIQVSIAKAMDEHLNAMLGKMQGVIDAVNENGFEAVGT